jgi:hypothetical protein
VVCLGNDFPDVVIPTKAGIQLFQEVPDAPVSGTGQAPLSERNGFYFEVNILGEPGDLDGRPGGRVGWKKGGIFLIDLNKISKVLQEDRGLYHLIKGQTLGLQDVLNIFENTAGLLPDISANQVSGRRVDGDLTGYKDEGTGLDGLGIRANGMGRFGGMDHLLFHVSSSHNRHISETLSRI